MFTFMIGGIIVLLITLVTADTLKQHAEVRRAEREHPGMVWTAAGWKPKSD